MDINQLEYFIKVAELQHVTKASEELHISQAALTQSIHNLEKELGVRFFDKVGRNIVLNEYGNNYYKYAVNAVNAVTQGKKILTEIKHENDNCVSIIAPTLCGFPDLFSKICKQCSNFKIAINSCEFPKIAPKIKNGDVDLAIIQRPILGEKIEGMKLHSFDLGVVVSKRHPLYDYDVIDINKLKEYEFASFSINYSQRMNLIDMCESNGWAPKVNFEVENYADIFRAVDSGKFISVVAPIVFNNYKTDSMKLIPIQGTNSRYSLWMYWHSENKLNSFASELKEILVKYFLDLE